MKAKKFKIQQVSQTFDLNIMPFIDIFSLLCTFLLFTAVFVSYGMHVVQVPFISNAPTDVSAGPKTVEKSLDLKVFISNTVRVQSQIIPDQKGKMEITFPLDKQGLMSLNGYVKSLKDKVPTAELVNIYGEDEVRYEDIVKVLDVLKSKLSYDYKFEGSLFSKTILNDVGNN